MRDVPTNAARPTAPSADPAGRPMLVIDGTKLLRLEAALDAVLDELPAENVNESETRRFDELTSRLLTEVGSTLPDPLLDELHRLLGAFSEPLSVRQLRLLLVQIEGWVDGLLDAFTIPVDRATAARAALLAAGFALRGSSDSAAQAAQAGPAGS